MVQIDQHWSNVHHVPINNRAVTNKQQRVPLLFNALKVGGHLVLNLPVSVLFEEFTVNVAVVMDLLGGSGSPTAVFASQFGGTRDEQALVLLIHLK